MADISITPANVILSPTGTRKTGIAGVAISAGQTIFEDNADARKLKLSEADATGKTNIDGIALNDAAVGQPVTFAVTDAELAIGATVAIGAILILSATPGGIAPAADAAIGMEVVIVGVGVGSNKVSCNFSSPNPIRSGAVIPA